jgi:hypothetical protein
MESTVAILVKYGKIGKELLKSSISSLRTTGETEKSIGFRVTSGKKFAKLVIFGRKFFQTLESGRSPRKSSTYGEFDKSLEKYLEAKSLQKKTTKSGKVYYKLGNSWMTPKSLAYLINKKGDKTYREGGRELYSNKLSDLTREIKKEVIEDYKGYFRTEIKKYFKNANVNQEA